MGLEEMKAWIPEAGDETDRRCEGEDERKKREMEEV